MSAFVDKVLVDLSDPAKVTALIAPSSDPSRTILKRLFASVYELPAASLHSVTDVDVVGSEFERPIFPPERTIGTWTQTIPSHTRTDIVYEGSNGLTPAWIDAVTELLLTVVLDVDPGEVESIVVERIEDFTTLAEFKARFAYLDLEAFIEAHGISTVQELKDAFDYLKTEIRLKPTGPIDPADPHNARHFRLKLAILVRDAVDIAAALREVKLALATVERSVAYAATAGDAEVRTPFAPIVVFPENAVADSGFTVAQLRDFFEAERVTVLVTNP